MEKHAFQADAQQILRLVTHSIYSEKEIFLRELLSNASDALDKARFLSLQDSGLRQVEGEAGIRISIDKDAKTLTIEDDGVGMTKEEIMKTLVRLHKVEQRHLLKKPLKRWIFKH